METSLGIDLASQDKKTAACVIEWDESSAAAREPRLGSAKGSQLDWLLQLCVEANWVGIDAPFGWPDPMVHAVAAWSEGKAWPTTDPRDLRLRLTDQHVREHTGLTPLSVSSDRIAIVAWRCAQLLSALAENAKPIDRAGNDGVYEVYPGAALHCWGLDRAGYKTRGSAEAKLTQRAARAALIDELTRRAPWLELSQAREACIDSDDALDALIAALVARAASREATIPAPPHQRARAAREGWIHLPTPGSLDQLL